MPAPFAKLIQPWYPAAAIGLDSGLASLVFLEKARGRSCAVRRAATMSIARGLLQPSFDQPNILNPGQLASVLRELASSAGLIRQKRWSLTLPQASTRTLVMNIEANTSGSELQDVLNWKMERGLGAPLESLVVSKERLPRDSKGRERYVVAGMSKAVLEEYEQLFASLGWRIGLILPRHLGESQWLIRNGSQQDSLLLSSTNDGFTAVVLRDKHPLILRSVACGAADCEDELYRLLLFYRDRRSDEKQDAALSRFMVVGDGFTKTRAREIVADALGADLRPLEAADVGLELPGNDLSFDSIAAPAGLASLAL